MLLKKEEFYIMEVDNEYHTWLRSTARKHHNLSYERIDASNTKQLSRLRTVGVLEVPTMFICEFNQAPTSAIISLLAESKLKNRIVILLIKKMSYASQFRHLRYNKPSDTIASVNLSTAEHTPIEVKSYEEWTDKEEFIQAFIIPKTIKFKESATYASLIRLAIVNEDMWHTISTLGNYFDSAHKITNEEIYDIFPNIEFISLKSWVKRVFIGTSKNITFKELDYFISVKNYSPYFMLSHLQQEVLKLDIVFSAYRKGIVSLYMENNVTGRADAIGWQHIVSFNSVKKKDRNWCYSIIPYIPYPYFIQLRNILVGTDKENCTLNTLYQTIIQIQLARNNYKLSLEEKNK